MGDHTSHALHAVEWEMLAEERAHIDLMRAIFATAPRETRTCQHGHVHAELYEPDMRFVLVTLN